MDYFKDGLNIPTEKEKLFFYSFQTEFKSFSLPFPLFFFFLFSCFFYFFSELKLLYSCKLTKTNWQNEQTIKTDHKLVSQFFILILTADVLHFSFYLSYLIYSFWHQIGMHKQWFLQIILTITVVYGEEKIFRTKRYSSTRPNLWTTGYNNLPNEQYGAGKIIYSLIISVHQCTTWSVKCTNRSFMIINNQKKKKKKSIRCCCCCSWINNQIPCSYMIHSLKQYFSSEQIFFCS